MDMTSVSTIDPVPTAVSSSTPPVVTHIIEEMTARHACVPIRSSADVITARQRARAMAALAGFQGSDLTLIATAISEIVRNIVEYADNGEVLIAIVTKSARTGIEIVATDTGPGIPDVAAVMQDGYSTAGHLGIGLPGARRLVDEFAIDSALGRGTTVTMRKWLR